MSKAHEAPMPDAIVVEAPAGHRDNELSAPADGRRETLGVIQPALSAVGVAPVGRVA